LKAVQLTQKIVGGQEIISMCIEVQT